MSDKDNILDFNEMKNKLNNDKKNESKEKGEFSFWFDAFGIDEKEMQNVKTLEDLLSLIDVETFADGVQSGKIDPQKVLEEVDKMKLKEKELSDVKKTYRAFGQWQSFYKPYNLTTLFSLSQIQNIAKFMDIEYHNFDSKNSIIEKIKQIIPDYLEKLFLQLDMNFMKFIGMAMYNDGVINVDRPMLDSDEIVIDFLQQKCILARVNEMGKHIIVIPREIKESIDKINFKKIGKYNELNTFINKTAIAFANSYGVYPKSIFLNRVKEEIEQNYAFINNPDEYIQKSLNYFFNQKNSMNSLYLGINVEDDYIKHGVISLTKYLFDLQNENIENYKHLSKEDILKRGDILYFEDSIHLKEVLDVMSKHQKFDQDETINIKNLLYIFSFIEFEPSLILEILLSKYQIDEIAKVKEVLRRFYQNSEKWILKGHTPFEVNNKNIEKNIDMSNIVKLNLNNEREENE